MADRTLRVCALYPDLMNIYADRGNLLLLERRCAVARARLRAARAPASATRWTRTRTTSSTSAAARTATRRSARTTSSTVKRDALHAAADRGAVVFAVCGGYQLLGHGYAMGDERLPGVGLVDLETVREDGPRLIGNVAIEVSSPAGQVLAGFENHGGRTRLGPDATPLGRVLRGHGNDGRSGQEGVRGGKHDTVVGTYLHGPLLPKNAYFADWLTATALGIAPAALAPLDDALESAAHAAARRAAGV